MADIRKYQIENVRVPTGRMAINSFFDVLFIVISHQNLRSRIGIAYFRQLEPVGYIVRWEDDRLGASSSRCHGFFP